MTPINPHRAGLALGALIGGWHFLWALLVAIGWAQFIVDFVFWMHFMKPIIVITPFSLATAVVLITVTAIVGYVFGYVFSALWNWMHR